VKRISGRNGEPGEEKAGVKYVPEGDILLIPLRDGQRVRTLEPLDEVFVDVDDAGRALAIEVIGVHEQTVADLVEVLQQYDLVVAPKEWVRAGLVDE
jgi:uncharacterized protein YuzE